MRTYTNHYTQLDSGRPRSSEVSDWSFAPSHTQPKIPQGMRTALPHILHFLPTQTPPPYSSRPSRLSDKKTLWESRAASNKGKSSSHLGPTLGQFGQTLGYGLGKPWANFRPTSVQLEVNFRPTLTNLGQTSGKPQANLVATIPKPIPKPFLNAIFKLCKSSRSTPLISKR